MTFFEPTVFFLILYGLQIIKFEKGWDRLVHKKMDYKEGASVIVAVRDESNNINKLLTNLSNQSYSPLEIIIVDDESSDDTVDKVKEFSCVNLVRSEGGKKTAIKKGVSKAKFPVILTTDADCELSEFWAENMLSPFSNNDHQLSVGPVAFYPERNIFEKLQSLDFMSLIVCGAGAIANDQGFMCNGANLAFRKNIYTDLNLDEASGDDVFLLHYIKRLGKKIKFIKNIDSIVYTDPAKDFQSFYNQRKRWAAKSSAYKDKDAIRISWLVFVTNLFLIFLLFSGTVYQICIGFVIKALIDFPILKKATQFFNKQKILIYFYPLQLIYPFYIFFIAITSQIGSFEWKGRKHRR